jgi:hypothetical protein
VRTLFQQKSEGLLYPLLAIDGAEVVVFGGNAQSAQSKTGGCNARHTAEGPSDDGRPVTHQAAPGAGLVEEEIGVPARHVVQKGFRHSGDLGERAINEDAGRVGVFFRRLALRLGGIAGGGRLVLRLFAIRQTRHSEGERSASARLAQKLPAGYSCLGQCKFILKIQKSGQMQQHCELF